MILITEFMDEAAVDRLAAAAPTRYDPDLVERQQDLPKMLADVRALIVRNRTQVTAAVLEAAPELTVVGRLGVGLDNIDTAACADRGVVVIPATGANNVSVAEYVLTTALVLLRDAFRADDQMLAGEWPRAACAGREGAGKKLGLIGFGAIARETATRALALGLDVCANDPFVPTGDPAWSEVSPVDLDTLLEQADVVSLHVPLTADTHHLMNPERINRMRPDAILINAARGGIVDEAALADALRSGRLGGAALDVFETEPLTAEAAETFRNTPNLILTPHIAGVTRESNVRVSDMIAERVLDELGASVDETTG